MFFNYLCTTWNFARCLWCSFSREHIQKENFLPLVEDAIYDPCHFREKNAYFWLTAKRTPNWDTFHLTCTYSFSKDFLHTANTRSKNRAKWQLTLVEIKIVIYKHCCTFEWITNSGAGAGVGKEMIGIIEINALIQFREKRPLSGLVWPWRFRCALAFKYSLHKNEFRVMEWQWDTGKPMMSRRLDRWRETVQAVGKTLLQTKCAIGTPLSKCLFERQRTKWSSFATVAESNISFSRGCVSTMPEGNAARERNK